MHFCFRPLWEDEMFARKGGQSVALMNRNSSFKGFQHATLEPDGTHGGRLKGGQRLQSRNRHREEYRYRCVSLECPGSPRCFEPFLCVSCAYEC